MTIQQDLRDAQPPRPDVPPPPAETPLKCARCDSDAGDANKCPVCGALQKNVKRCRVCRDVIPKDAHYCNGCKSYQPWILRYVSFSSTMMALLTAVLSLLVALAPRVDALINRHSNTSFTVTGADANAIYVHVMNSGRKPSIIRECSLTIGQGTAATTVALDFLHGDTHDAKNVIRPTSETALGLTATGLTATGLTANPDDETPVTLTMNIEESSGKQPRTETFHTKRIHEFFAKVPGGQL